MKCTTAIGHLAGGGDPVLKHRGWPVRQLFPPGIGEWLQNAAETLKLLRGHHLLEMT
jgi:hypothetical protein